MYIIFLKKDTGNKKEMNIDSDKIKVHYTVMVTPTK